MFRSEHGDRGQRRSDGHREVTDGVSSDGPILVCGLSGGCCPAGTGPGPQERVSYIREKSSPASPFQGGLWKLALGGRPHISGAMSGAGLGQIWAGCSGCFRESLVPHPTSSAFVCRDTGARRCWGRLKGTEALAVGLRILVALDADLLLCEK